MPLPIVVIVAEDPAVPVPARSVVVASCVRVSGEGRCVEATHPYASAAPYSAAVTVLRDGRLMVQLRSRSDQVLRADRELVFSGATLGDEHWNAAGLVIAALIADVEGARASLEPAPPTTQSAAAAPQSDAGRARDPWLSAAWCAVISQGFSFDPWRLGTEFRVFARLGHAALYPVLSTRWSSASGLVQSRTLSAALGLGYERFVLPNVLAASVETSLVSDTLLVSATTPDGPEQSYRFRYGGRLGVGFNLRLVSELRGLVGAEASWLNRRAVLVLNGERLGAEPRFMPGFTLGLSYRF